MKNIALLLLTLCSLGASAQNFDLIDRQESYQTGLSENLRIPLRIKNNSDKAQFYVIRKVSSDLGGTQKGYFCLDKNCLEAGIEEFSKRVEPGETLTNLAYTLETGLVSGQNNLRFEIFVKGLPHDFLEHNVSISIDEKLAKTLVFKSKDITIHDVYPNPAVDQAFVDYQIHNEAIKAKVVVHNILGSPIGNYDLPFSDLKVKIQTDELPAGVYFYTLYLDNDGVLTRKLIVRK
ncbi:MAG TPA: T9SS type A sorting domain-containing protein [Cyclobacteriaceae bacterium]